MNIDIERSFVMKFVSKDKKRRILEMLEKPKKREKLRRLLPHSALFDPKWICHIPRDRQQTDEIYQMLRNKHSPENCYLISSAPGFDGIELSLKEALDQIKHLVAGTIIICIPEQLAYFEGEVYGDRYILCDPCKKP